MNQSNHDAALASLSNQNFSRHEADIHERTDRMFAWLMAFQYVIAIGFALIVSPRTWEGAVQQTHPHVWLAVILGGILAAYPIYLALRHPGEVHTRHVIAISQALFSALLIHLTGGRIETHFHVFGSLAFLAFYRDWRVLVSASIIVAADHFVRGAWFPFSVYGVYSGAEWRFLEHAGWVLFEDAFLIAACINGIREMKSMALRQAELQIAKEEVEQTTNSISRQSAVLNSVMTGMSDGVVVADMAGNFIHFNPAAERILGQGARKVPLEQWSQCYGVLADDEATPYPSERLPLARALKGESADLEQLKVKRASLGDDVWIEISGRPLIGSEGDHCGGVVVFRDITERRRVQQESAQARRLAEQANKAKSEFLSRMSHELRTPLNSILGFGQLLQMDELGEDQKDSVDQIVSAGTHLLKLINEVLDISRIEAGRLAISQEPVDVHEVVREVVGLLQPLSKASNVTIEHAQVGSETFAFADRQRLLQVVMNLVSNSIKYNKHGGTVAIEISQRRGLVRLEVSDTGIGIPTELRSLIFTPFERLGAEQTGVEGTGLGLALSKRLIEAMGGRIDLAPSTNGSRFFIELAEASCPGERLVGDPDQRLSSAGSSCHASAKILLIEDNPANVRLVEKILHSRPEYNLVVANSGAQGLQSASANCPDLILLDINLPDMGGRDVLQHIKADRRLSHIPVVVVSADATPSQVELLTSEGAFAYMTKPLDVQRFLSMIDETCVPRRKKSA